MRWKRNRAAGYDADALIEVATVALGFGDRGTALMALDDASTKAVGPAQLHDIALFFWQQLGEVRRAEALLRRGADAGFAPAMSALGVLLQQMNQAREAEVWLRKAANKGDVDAVNNLGNLLERQGDLAAAAEFWRRAAEAGSAMAMSSLALALFTHGRQEEARQWCERALPLTTSQERTDPAVRGKLELVSRALNSGDSMPERPFKSARLGSPVRVDIAGGPLAVVAALHAKFLAERDPGVLEKALPASRQAVGHTEPGSREHAEALRIRGSLLRAEFECKRDPALLEEAVKSGRAALGCASEGRARGHAQSSLGATLLVKHGVLDDDGALDEAITALEDARRLLGADDPEWPGITSTLGGALTQQYMREAETRGRGDTSLIDAAISHLEAAIAATPPTDPELPGRQYNLAMAKIQLGMQTESHSTMREGATLLREAMNGMPAQHPARAAAALMLTALGDSSL